MDRLAARELVHLREVRRWKEWRRRAGQAVRVVFLEEIPAAGQGEFEAVVVHIRTQAVLVPMAPDVHEDRQSGSVGVELLRGGEGRPVLHIAAITGAKLEARRRKQNDVVILQAAAGVAEVQ